MKFAVNCCWSMLVASSVSLTHGADLPNLAPNTWEEIKVSTEQPAGTTEKGAFARQGWNKIVYDPDGTRVLFYDRWLDNKHGGQTIYGNCLFALDPATGTLKPLKIDNWTKVDVPNGG